MYSFLLAVFRLLSFLSIFCFHLLVSMFVLNHFVVLKLSLGLQKFYHFVLLSFHNVCDRLRICLHSSLVGGIYRISGRVLVLLLFRLGWCVLCLEVQIVIVLLFGHYRSFLLLLRFLLSICLIGLRLRRRLLCWNNRQKSPKIRSRLADSLLYCFSACSKCSTSPWMSEITRAFIGVTSLLVIIT